MLKEVYSLAMRIRTTVSRLNRSYIPGLFLLVILLLTFPLIVFLFQHLAAYRQLPPDGQGLYEGCPPSRGQMCLDRLKQMASGGFTLVVNYDQMSANASQEIAYADQANVLGMKVIWNFSQHAWWDGTNLVSYFPALTATCNCSDNTGFTKYFVNLVKNLPGTWGYYVGDEISTSVHTQWKAFADLIKQTDPGHPRLLVLGSTSAYTNTNFPMFADGADVFVQDYYPISYHSQFPISGTATVARGLLSITRRYDKQLGMVLQAHSLGEYSQYSTSCSPFPRCEPYPTFDQMHQMRDFVLQNSTPQLILWYSYFDILRSDNPTQHWHDLVMAAQSRWLPFP